MGPTFQSRSALYQTHNGGLMCSKLAQIIVMTQCTSKSMLTHSYTHTCTRTHTHKEDRRLNRLLAGQCTNQTDVQSH